MNCPCQECEYRQPTCHDFCREYLEWHDWQRERKEKAALDKILDGITEWMLHRETRVKR